jgi:hypothetical protein
MEAIAINIISAILFGVLYLLAILTIARLLIGMGCKLPEKLQWICRILEVPVIGPVIYWFYFIVSGKKKEKHKTHSK